MYFEMLKLMINKMDGLNPGEMAGSYDTVGFKGGDIEIDSKISKMYSPELNIDYIENSSLSLEESIKLYKTVGPRNGDFLFKWLYEVYDKTYVPSIDSKYREQLALDKTKLCIFDVLVDDLADNEKLRNKEHLEEALTIPINGKTKSTNPYLKVTEKIWNDCINSIRTYPRYEEFKSIFNFDLMQVLNSMQYSFLSNEIGFSNEIEDEKYLNHGVMVILHCVMDLMCSPEFNKEELPQVRSMLNCVQDVAHIGNLLNTYPKEINERDFSSPIIAKGLREGIITKEIVIDNPKLALSKLKPLENHYKLRMKKNLKKIMSYVETIKSIDVPEFCNKLIAVWDGFLNRERYWENKEEN
ncbi:MAG: hypothetical protein ACTSRI_21810 [Promethearchaeota archaeon]